MILNDKQIQELVIEHAMIDPFLPHQSNRPGVISFGLSSYGYDFRCGNRFKIFHNVYNTLVNPKKISKETYVEMNNTLGECVIPPNGFALSYTLERFKMPKDIIGLCIGKSTYARCGIIINVTPIEPEWEGHITIEISNTTPNPCIIYAGEGIGQLLFFKGDLPAVTYETRHGKYQNQPADIVLPKVV